MHQVLTVSTSQVALYTHRAGKVEKWPLKERQTNPGSDKTNAHHYLWHIYSHTPTHKLITVHRTSHYCTVQCVKTDLSRPPRDLTDHNTSKQPVAPVDNIVDAVACITPRLLLCVEKISKVLRCIATNLPADQPAFNKNDRLLCFLLPSGGPARRMATRGTAGVVLRRQQ